MRLIETPTAPPKPLRPYQVEGLNDLRRGIREGFKRQVLVSPTGSGKTRLGSEMVSNSAKNRNQTLWLADRRELVKQASQSFTELGISHGLVIPGHKPSENEMVLCGTVQSFAARLRSGELRPEHVKVIFIDECHRNTVFHREILATYPDATVVGLTATPVGPIGQVYQRMVQPVTTRQLIEQGFLVKPRYFIPSEIEMLRLQAGREDFTQAQIDEYAERHPKLIGDIVQTFATTCPDRRAVCFPSNIRHSIAIRDAFLSVGIPAVHIDGTMEPAERDALMEAFKAGVYQVLCSVNIAIEGVDVPDVSCVIIARLTQSIRIWIQAVGRGLRSHPGKQDCIVLDHSGAFTRLGPAEDYEDWTLDGTAAKQRAERGKQPREPRDPKEITCEQCHAVFFAAKVCPECGHVHTYERAPKDVEVAEGELLEATREGRKKAEYTDADKQRWYSELLWYVESKGKKPGAAFYMFQEKFKEKPGVWQRNAQPQPPSPDVLSWIRSRNIRFAKRKQKEQHAAD